MNVPERFSDWWLLEVADYPTQESATSQLTFLVQQRSAAIVRHRPALTGHHLHPLSEDRVALTKYGWHCSVWREWRKKEKTAP